MVLILSVLATLAFPIASAGAAPYCPSGQYVQQSYSYNGAVVATLCTNGGLTGPATLQSQGQYRGVEKYMSLEVCKWRQSGPYACASDAGQFSYYAGPLQQPGGCQYFRSLMNDGHGNRIVSRTWILCN